MREGRKDENNKKDEYVAYVGTYTHGSSIGIHLYDVNVEEGTLTERKVIPVNNSSHIARSLNGKYLYSIADEGVAVFAVEDDGDLTPINKVDIDGMRGCYLSVDKTGRYLFVAGYHDGKVTVVHTHKDGRLGSLMDGVFHKGLGSVAERNFRPHVSCVVPTPDNKYVCAVDNGIDQIKMYKLNTQRDRLKLVDILRCERESGPREIVFSESGKYAYVIYELMNKVDVFSYRDTGNGPEFEKLQSISTTSANVDQAHDAASGMCLSPDHHYLFTSTAGDNTVAMFHIDPETGCPNFFSLKANYKIVEQMIEEGKVASACAEGYGGIAEALFKMGLGNRIGFKMRADMPTHRLFEPMYGSIVLEMVSDSPAGELLGETTKDYTYECCGETLDMAELQEIWESKLEPVYPYRKAGANVDKINGRLEAPAAAPKIGVAKPKVIIPVFPGTNCEYDTAHAFARAGADPEILVIRNLTPADVTASCEALVKAIGESQIVMLPGGFSGGDEPDGSAKFIASFFRNPAVTEAVRELLQKRDGLMLGICNGFQALIKLGLVPYGDIRPITSYDPTLTFNTIGRHQSMLVRTRIASTGSPWLSHCDAGSEYEIAISHGEGRFVAPQNVLDQLIANGQVATQYVDLEGEPTMDQRYNPNGSLLAIEGITSPDGRVFGKMGHSERSGEYLYKNVTGDKYQPIFEGGVDYFKV